MKTTTLTTLLLLPHLLWSQNASSIAFGSYRFTDSLKNTCTITLSPGHQFEFIYDPYFDCTPAFGIYSKGQFSTNRDSIILHCDSIPHLPSSYTLDSIDNSDNTIDIQLLVTDQHQQPLSNWTLNWEKPIQKRRKTSIRFFSSQFDSPATIHFEQQGKVRYVSVEQPGYYSVYIPLSLTGAKDYIIQIVLRPQPPVAADNYLSNQTILLKMVSGAGIELAPGWILTRVEE